MTKPPAPLRFGDFELLEVLGGSMGTVYRARRAGDPAECALKLLRHERLLDGESRARFQREVAALAQLQHPHICPLLDSGTQDGIPWLCMPLLSSALAPHRHDGTAAPSWRDAVSLGAKVASALATAHEHGIVHRDVKPSNVLLDEFGAPRLVDFGLALDAVDRYRHLTRTGQVVGTPNYLAPEQIDSRFGRIDGRTDVYGLGAVLFELLTGQRAFTADSKAELYERILRDLPPAPGRFVPDLPDDVGVVLDRAMARRPRHRYASARDFERDLRCVLAGRPIAALRLRPWQRAWRRVCDRPREAATAATFVAATALLLGAVDEITTWKAQLTATGAKTDQASLLGRLEVARSAHRLLPPPRPGSLEVYDAWLREHGDRLAATPATLRQFTPGMDEFLGEAIADVTARRALAMEFGRRLDGDDVAAWRAAEAAVAADPRFAGFDLQPLAGLVPLGADPRSGLQEFYDLASGAPALPAPARAADGRLTLHDEHGIVFVLLPGGTFTPTWPADAPETLPPFLFAKHELTRAQHRRLDSGHDDSRWPLVETPEVHEQQTLRHPVDQVLYGPITAMLARWGLELPLQWEWEYAVRAGGQLDLATALRARGNVEGPADGFHLNAPVGSFAPDGYGLCDLIGNVGELAATGQYDKVAPRPTRTVCGMTFGSTPWLAYPAIADQRYGSFGARPVRRL